MATSHLDTFYITLLVFGAVSVAFYFFLIQPLISPPATRQLNGATNTGANTTQQNSNRQTSTGGSDSKLKRCSRVPLHVAPNSARLAANGGSNLLVDGLLAFRHSKAILFEQGLDESTQTANRRERARVFSRLLLNEGSPPAPPSKGSNIVLGIPIEDVGCPELRRIMYLLATYYNLLVIISVDSSFAPSDLAGTIQKLRGEENDENDQSHLSVDVAPNHRIVVSCTVAGRVAFVRQLQRIELVLDFDPEVKTQLNRFGHRVRLYGQNDGKVGPDADSTNCWSRLGSEVLSI